MRKGIFVAIRADWRSWG